ncbi:MAG: hypothetical protein COT39_01980 [Parcubacteria group bacterium CG08_land_8_20_14_0_20_48_21]|nr:MAG: hypothetical protein AUK21_03035 [Parcubacteria group bacterium CG2_30_48_51]PIS32948.1 MAG: hypothetical protein COT39_01980 [Parcubacteria group bacterium CG08_land_8_20_14_0_20_48_21]PIW79155.1 MAG: hypothetical protein COZ99_02635 [Parcubacteria group bacterium CG_4_8_14_3_um_filter_48_16]PIY77803.1 MAG: hypothetical protein COY83_03300 [Parcubacteria group bacterium CG_4_10_14_0_8_um_filter_48_154]PIZ77984.1 MAG: hypothetical protein COY03_00810 [bacterium CG_4_10_14_0_2_um_filter_
MFVPTTSCSKAIELFCIVDRLSTFPDYLPKDTDPDKLFHDTPYVEKVLHNFVDFVTKKDETSSII